MAWTEDERRLMNRGGWGLAVGLGFGLVAVGLAVGFAAMMVAIDEPFAARGLWGFSLASLGGGAVLVVGGCAGMLARAVRART